MRAILLILITGLAGNATATAPLPGTPAPIEEIGQSTGQSSTQPPAQPLGPSPATPPAAVQPPPSAIKAAPPVTSVPPVPAPALEQPQASEPPPAPSRAAVRRHLPLTRLLPPRAIDKAGWAADMAVAFKTLHIAPTTENYCTAIAVIEQESSFRADPEVPGLGKIVWKEIEARRDKYGIPAIALETALRLPSPDGRSYKERIDALKTEKQMNDLFEDMISELPLGRTLFSSLNPIRTGGPMQVSVEFAEEHARSKPYPYKLKGRSIRDEVFTRRGGVYFGIANLLDYPAPYSKPLYRFADFNAGRYSSRNAAFQAAVSRLAKGKLDLDGDLLRYENGEPADEPSSTLQALLPLGKKLGLSAAEIQRDLRQEKRATFTQTELYRRVFALADKKAGKRLSREALPKIRLEGPKIQRKLTTAWFAKRVNGRYQRCVARARSAP